MTICTDERSRMGPDLRQFVNAIDEILDDKKEVERKRKTRF